MGLFSWLFGSKPQWQMSENGNPMMLFGQTRVTVFESDGGWKYCIADIEEDDDPHFSDPYESQAIARAEALAHINGEPSRNRSLSEGGRERRRDRWEAEALEKRRAVQEIREALAEPDLNVTALRKIEAKVASRLRQLSWQKSQFLVERVSDAAIREAETAERELAGIEKIVEQRITERKAQSRKRS